MAKETSSTEARVRPGVVPEPKEAAVVKLIIELYRKGWALTPIARELEKRGIRAPEGGTRWHPGIVRSILRRPLNAGLIHHEGRYIKGAHYPHRLIEPEEFYEILEEMGRRKPFPPRSLSCPQAPFANLVYCAECGKRMYVTNRVEYRAYRCDAPTRSGTPCSSRPYVRTDHLETRAVREIERIARNPGVVAAARQEAARLLEEQYKACPETTERLEAELVDVEKKWEALAERHAEGRLSDELLEAYDRTLSTQKNELRLRLTQTAGRDAAMAERKGQARRAFALLGDFPALWSQMEPEEKRALVQAVVERVTVGRADGRVRVRLKLYFMDEVVFDLPVGGQWQRARTGVAKPPLFPRQLAYLALVSDGFTDAQIAAKWQMRLASVRRNRYAAVQGMGVATVDEAIAKLGTALDEWRHMLPLEGRHGRPKASQDLLNHDEMTVLRLTAMGMDCPEIAADLGVPVTTVAGRLSRARTKLDVRCKEAAVAKASQLGLLAPSERSPSLLLRAYERLSDPAFRLRVKEQRLRQPTAKQLECLGYLVEGLSAGETARRMGVCEQAIVFLRMRTWGVVGATSLSGALDRVEKLGVLDWVAVEPGSDNGSGSENGSVKTERREPE